MSFAFSSCRRNRLALVGVVLFVIAGCSEEKPAPPPVLNVNPPATAPKPARASDIGPGSGSGAYDSTRP